MASGDYLELAQRAARAARFDPDNTTDLTRAKEAINQAYLDSCAGGIQFDFLEQEGQWTTTSGSDTYTYASIATATSVSGARIAEILTLTNDTDGTVLEPMSWHQLETLGYSTQDGDSSGRPLYWAKWGAKIRLYPKPDDTYTIGAFMRLVPTEMSSDTDTPVLPLEYRHSILVTHAASNLLRQEGGGEAQNDAQFYWRQYETAWERMRTATATATPGRATFRLKSPLWDSDHASIARGDPWSWTR